MKESIIIGDKEGLKLDKMKIALAIKSSTFEDSLTCSIIDNEIIKDCGSCSLKFICDGVDSLAEEYKEKTTEVINSFSFD